MNETATMGARPDEAPGGLRLPPDGGPPPPANPVDVRKLVLQVFGAAFIFFGSLGILAWWFKEPLQAWSLAFVEAVGGPGVLVGYYIPDAFTVPIPNDAFAFFGLLGDIDYWEVVAWGSTGSLLGGSTGFAIGRKLSHTRWFHRYMDRHGREAYDLFRRYGVAALVVAALTPFPYSICCWVSGAMGMRLGIFLLVSMLRIPRVAFYLWLIQIGIFTVVG